LKEKDVLPVFVQSEIQEVVDGELEEYMGGGRCESEDGYSIQ